MKLLFTFLVLCLLSCRSNTYESTASSYQLVDSYLWSNYAAKDHKKNKHIILISGDEEYRSEEVLPEMANILSSYHGYDCTVLYAQDPERLGIIDPNYSDYIPGLHQLQDADLMVMFTRFRSLADSQMVHIDQYLNSGKPVLGIRTATHAFNFSDSTHSYAHYGWNYQGSKTEWHLGFGKRILGETWYTHHGHHQHQSTRGIINGVHQGHPILSGIKDSAIWGATDVYGIRPDLGEQAQVLIYGQSIDRSQAFDKSDLTYGMRETDSIPSTSNPINSADGFNPNESLPPIVWLNSYQLPSGLQGRSFTSTIGSSTDFLDEDVRSLLINAVHFMLNDAVPNQSMVTLSETYDPSQFAFKSDAYWDSLNIIISNIN